MGSIERVHRLLRVIELLQAGRSYNTRELAEECRVSRRTIFRDLGALEECGIHVSYDEAKQGYFLPAKTFLPATDFSLDETLSLLVLCHELGNGDRGVPFYRSARTAALKLLSSLPNQITDYVGELTEAICLRLDPRNPLENSRAHYDLMTQSITRKKQVRITYRSLTEWKDITTALSPYRMLFIRRSWYVIGRSSLHRSVRTFNVGRILNAETIDTSYQIPARFSLDRYLGNAWTMIRERGNRRHVVVRFKKMVAYNVAEVRWHKTQRLVWNEDESVDFHVTVDGIREILWWILGYGDQAEVLEPPELRDMVREHAESMCRLYDSPKRTRPSHKAS